MAPTGRQDASTRAGGVEWVCPSTLRIDVTDLTADEVAYAILAIQAEAQRIADLYDQ